ncbi:MAG TPA: caspase family protein [Candidatus Angelobacter sp.]
MSATFNRGYALLIGVGGNLPCTITDAKGIQEILVDPLRCAYPPENVRVLTEQDATANRIRGELKRLAVVVNAAQQQSTVIVYFSGHGWKVGNAFYLIPAGFNSDDLSQTALEGGEFTSLLTAIRSERFLLLLDCCHAGEVEIPKTKGVQLIEQSLSPEIVEVFKNKHGRALIASSTGEENSLCGRPYSAFTYSLLEAFCGMGNSKRDGFVRVSDLVTYVSQKVPAKTNDRQHPVVDFSRADNFEVAYYGAGGTEVKPVPFDSFELVPSADRTSTPASAPAPSTRVRNKLKARGQEGMINFAGLKRSGVRRTFAPIDVDNDVDVRGNRGEVNFVGVDETDSSGKPPSRAGKKGN